MKVTGSVADLRAVIAADLRAAIAVILRAATAAARLIVNDTLVAGRARVPATAAAAIVATAAEIPDAIMAAIVAVAVTIATNLIAIAVGTATAKNMVLSSQATVASRTMTRGCSA